MSHDEQVEALGHVLRHAQPRADGEVLGDRPGDRHTLEGGGERTGEAHGEPRQVLRGSGGGTDTAGGRVERSVEVIGADSQELGDELEVDALAVGDGAVRDGDTGDGDGDGDEVTVVGSTHGRARQAPRRGHRSPAHSQPTDACMTAGLRQRPSFARL